MKLEKKRTIVELYKLVEIFFDKYKDTKTQAEIDYLIQRHLKLYPRENILHLSIGDYYDVFDDISIVNGFDEYLVTLSHLKE